MPPETLPVTDVSGRAALLAELARKWGIAVIPDAGADEFEAAVRRALAERVLRMMLHQPDRLMAALYVLDVSENAFREAMNRGATPADQADALAGIILERELRRILTRARYRQEKGTPPLPLEHTPPEPAE